MAIFVFGFSMYSTSDMVGRYAIPSPHCGASYTDFPPCSPSRLYDLIQEASVKMPIAGNYQGSYLTFKSINGLVFAIDLLVAGKNFPQKKFDFTDEDEVSPPSGWIRYDMANLH